MIAEEERIITAFLDSIRTDLIHSLQAAGRYATGDTIKRLEIVINENSGQLLAPSYLQILEDGRPPTSPGAPPADPTVFERIKIWCDAKGIDQKFAYAITQAVHKRGFKGRPGVISEPLSTDNIQKHLNEAGQDVAALFTAQIRNIFNKRL